MYIGRISVWLAPVLALLLAGGCGKSSADKAAPGTNATAKLANPPAQKPEPVAQFHWLGKKRLAQETNAAAFMAIWNLPESAKLENQTLDRLAGGLLRLAGLDSQVSKGVESRGAHVEGGTNALTNTVESRTPNLESRTNRQPSLPSPDSTPPVPGAQPLTNNSRSGTNAPALGSRPAALDSPPLLNPSVADRLRPLLSDLLQEESWCQVRQAGTNQPGELALAIRLKPERAALWQTNLAMVLEAVTHIRPLPAPSGQAWSLKKHDPPNLVEFCREGEWVLIGLAQNQNALLTSVSNTIAKQGAPFTPPATNYWLEADLDLHRLGPALGRPALLPAGFPRIAFTCIGDGTNVHTRGYADFPHPLALDSKPWSVPTNLISEPLVSFTALRGLGPWVSSLNFWKNLQLGSAPNQLFVWAQSGTPFLTYAAAPVPAATNFVARLSDHLLKIGNPYLTNVGLGRLDRGTNGNGVVWKNLPAVEPYLEVTTNEWVTAAFAKVKRPFQPMPEALLAQLQADPNLVYYDWEVTGPRIEQTLFCVQLVRFALDKAQVPPPSVSVAWLGALAQKLGNAGTMVTRSGPSRLNFVRSSAIGFTALDLQLLVDWLESPDFPKGLNTFHGKPSPLPRPHHH